MCCTPEEWERLSEESKNVMPTHVAPSYTHHPRTGDIYSAYNKPVAVIDWLARNDVKEDYVLIIDADMIMRAPFVPDNEGARPGRAVSAYFGYMKGVNNKLALKHIPEVLPRNDTLAGPKGRRSDMVGGFTMMYTRDLRKVAPLWLKYTEDVRFDPDAWTLSGDAYTKSPGDKPWISEMYGYSYACAKSDVWHLTHRSAMLYPGYDVSEPPKVLHYGLEWEVAGTEYEFDKHWHFDFDAFQCPPWDMTAGPRDAKGGLFPHPPRASSFKTQGEQLLRDLLAIQVPITLNAAFCERHLKECPPSTQLKKECTYAKELEVELDRYLEKVEWELPDPCKDGDTRCRSWAKDGECETNKGFMYSTCTLACGMCKPRGEKASSVHHANANASGAKKGSTIGTGTGRKTAAPLKGGGVGGVKSEASGSRNRAKVVEDGGGEGASRHKRPDIGEEEVKGGTRTPDEVRRTAEGEDDDEGQVQNGDYQEGDTGEDDGNNTIKGKEEEEEEEGIAIDEVPDEDEDDVGGNSNSNTKTVGNEETKTALVAELKLRCTRFPRWSVAVVRRCMAAAEQGQVYDPELDDTDGGGGNHHGGGITSEQMHAQAHRLLEKTQTVGKMLGDGLKQRVHSAEAIAVGMTGTEKAMAWVGTMGLVVVVLQVTKKNRYGGKGTGYQYGRRIFNYGRVEARDE